MEPDGSVDRHDRHAQPRPGARDDVRPGGRRPARRAAPRTSSIVSGDTGSSVRGSGTYASRTAVIAGGSIIRAATDVRERLFELAAHMMECSVDDLAARRGPRVASRARPTATRRSPTWRSSRYFGGAAMLPPDFEPGLHSTRFYDPPETYSNGTTVAVVEVDPETGMVEIERLIAVEDCGVMLNPMIVEGQVAGARRPGHRRRAARGGRLRRRRPVRVGDPDGLPVPDDDGGAGDRGRPPRDAVHGHRSAA